MHTDKGQNYRAKTIEEASRVLNQHLRKIEIWAEKNRVKFNIAKLAVLTISNRKATLPPAKVYYNNILVKEVTHYKYLGLTVDSKLRWDTHINNVINKFDKVTRSLRGLAREGWGVKLTIFRNLNRAIFYPVMTYGICIWGWRVWFKITYNRFDKKIRKFGLLAI